MSAVEIKTPTLGESVSEATVANWYKKEGEGVAKDELLVELETGSQLAHLPRYRRQVFKIDIQILDRLHHRRRHPAILKAQTNLFTVILIDGQDPRIGNVLLRRFDGTQ